MTATDETWEVDLSPPADQRWRAALRLILGHTSTARLERLRDALADDDERLVQGVTCVRESVTGRPVAACLVGYCRLADGDEPYALQVEEYFARVMSRVAEHPSPAQGQHFTNWFDSVPRAEAFAAVATEVERELSRRAGRAHAN